MIQIQTQIQELTLEQRLETAYLELDALKACVRELVDNVECMQKEIERLRFDRDEANLFPGTFNLDVLERHVIIRALIITKFVQKDAAKLLGVSPGVLFTRIRKHQIKHPNWSKNRE